MFFEAASSAEIRSRLSDGLTVFKLTPKRAILTFTFMESKSTKLRMFWLSQSKIQLDVETPVSRLEKLGVVGICWLSIDEITQMAQSL